MIKKYLSREIHIYEGASVKKIKELSIAEVEYNSSGQPISVKTYPFQKEQPNIEYIDPPLMIKIFTQYSFNDGQRSFPQKIGSK